MILPKLKNKQFWILDLLSPYNNRYISLQCCSSFITGYPYIFLNMHVPDICIVLEIVNIAFF